MDNKKFTKQQEAMSVSKKVELKGKKGIHAFNRTLNSINYFPKCCMRCRIDYGFNGLDLEIQNR